MFRDEPNRLDGCPSLLSSSENSINHYFFVPVFNEQRSVKTILHNIRIASESTFHSRFFISDNASTDCTLESLLLIKNLYPEIVFLHKNKTNVGFAKNLLNVELLPANSLVTLLGANDYLCADGLRHLQRAIVANPNTELFVTNWAYFEQKACGARLRVYTGDVQKPFKAYSLDEYYTNMPYAPNGIMQFTASRETLLNIRPYSEQEFKNPQLGFFMDSFPCAALAVGSPPLVEVKHIERGGWRECKDTVVLAHKQVSDEMVLLTRKAYKEGRLSRETATKIITTYCKVAIGSLFLDWGCWRVPLYKRPYASTILRYALLSPTSVGSIKQILFSVDLMCKRCMRLLILVCCNPRLAKNTLKGEESHQSKISDVSS
jgi:hypothetical protein